MNTPKSSAQRSREFHKRQKEKGLRLVQFWVPDPNSPEFLEEARRTCEEINNHPGTMADQDWVDSVAVEWDSA
jgi:hypothetical protein